MLICPSYGSEMALSLHATPETLLAWVAFHQLLGFMLCLGPCCLDDCNRPPCPRPSRYVKRICRICKESTPPLHSLDPPPRRVPPPPPVSKLLLTSPCPEPQARTPYPNATQPWNPTDKTIYKINLRHGGLCALDPA